MPVEWTDFQFHQGVVAGWRCEPVSAPELVVEALDPEERAAEGLWCEQCRSQIGDGH